MTKNNTPQKTPTTKRKGLVEDLLAVTAGAVVRTAIDIAPRIGEMILSGATRDETLDALDAALRASRSAVSAALSVRHANMMKRQTAAAEAEAELQKESLRRHTEAAQQVARLTTCQRCGLTIRDGEHMAGLPPEPHRPTCLHCVTEAERAAWATSGSIIVPAPANIVWDDAVEEEKPTTRNERPDPSLKAE